MTTMHQPRSADAGGDRRTGPTVLFVARVSHFGGSAISLRTLLEHLDPTIRRTHVGATDGTVSVSLVGSGLVDEALAVRWRGGHAPLAAARILLWAVARRRRLAAIHANGSADLLLAWPAAVAARRPLVVWVHDQAIKRWAVRLAPLIRRLGVRWAAVSEFNADALVEARLARPGEVAIVPNPIDVDAVAGVPHVVDPGVRIGFLGTDTERKGFPLLPRVAERVAGGGVRLVVFANRHVDVPSPIVATWRELDSLGPERVEIARRLDDVRQAYARCDIVFIPSLRESFCRVAAEAMANGIPVVASDLPAVREVVGPDEAGLLFPPGDVEAAAAALRRLADDTVLRARLGAAGQVRSAAFAPDSVARRFEALYGLAGTAAPSSPVALDASRSAG